MNLRTQYQSTSRKHRRGGYLYIATLATTTIVAVIGLAAMSVARVKLKIAETGNDRSEAFLLSLSGIECGISNINANSSWRSTYSNDTEYPATPIALGNGTMTYKFVDDDGDLTDDTADIATLYGIGRVGDAVYVQTVTIEPDGNDMKIIAGSWQRVTAP